MSIFSFRRLVVSAAMGMLAVTAFVVAAPTAANAHDQVLSTAPMSQERLDVAPEAVRMIFTNDILDIGATILVVDAAGTNWASGEMQLAGTEATQAVTSDMPEGNYQVRWRVVSSDGHPISGTFDFAIGQTASTAVPSIGEASVPVADLPEATDSNSSRNEPVEPPLLLIGIGGALGGIALVVVITVLVSLRRRRI